MMMLDELDKKILGALRVNGRIKFNDLAASLGVAYGTVDYRVKRMVRCGVIKRFTVVTSDAGPALEDSTSLSAFVDACLSTVNVVRKENDLLWDAVRMCSRRLDGMNGCLKELKRRD